MDSALRTVLWLASFPWDGARDLYARRRRWRTAGDMNPLLRAAEAKRDIGGWARVRSEAAEMRHWRRSLARKQLGWTAVVLWAAYVLTPWRYLAAAAAVLLLALAAYGAFVRRDAGEELITDLDPDEVLRLERANLSVVRTRQAEIRNQLLLKQLTAADDDTAPWRPFEVTTDWPLVEGKRREDHVPLGETRDGVPVWMSLNVHCLVAGRSGSGKTQMIRSIITAAMDQAVPVVLFSPKEPSPLGGDDFSGISNRCVEYGVGIDAMGRLALVLDQLVRQMPRLQTRTMVVVDEVTDALADPDHGTAIRASLETLARRGRSFGVVLVLGVQRPTRDGLPAQVKANMMVTVAMGTRAEEDVRYLVGQDAKAQGVTCHKWVPQRDAGMAWVLGLDMNLGEPVLIRGWQVTDEDVRFVLDESLITADIEVMDGLDGDDAEILEFVARSALPPPEQVLNCQNPRCGVPLPATKVLRGTVHCGAPRCRTAVSRARSNPPPQE